jgi:hypothetical protein
MPDDPDGIVFLDLVLPGGKDCVITNTWPPFLQAKDKVMSDPKQRNDRAADSKLPAADTGNASNPSPHDTRLEPLEQDQLLDDKAEKYLREAGNIEDMPDAEEDPR